MELYLGQGSRPYRELIEQAVEAWNESLNESIRPPLGDVLIKIKNARPTTYNLPSSFWDDHYENATEPLYDGQNVIYFIPATDEGSLRGVAHRPCGFDSRRWHSQYITGINLARS